MADTDHIQEDLEESLFSKVIVCYRDGHDTVIDNEW
jgi:hypothetical protein